ncbi:response regulator transcription factor [Bifidobacterium aesculapii]|uniref:response regulator transcription factor n=1 Tax=Bifidobacterium aesculapii TaxID=1329411 RepID=UPI00128F4DDF|nr:response regulator transcription factor [Bifidobacterium aesculapii]
MAVGDVALSRAVDGTLTRAGYAATCMEPELVNAFGTAVGHALHNTDEPFDVVVIDSSSLLTQIEAVSPHPRTLLFATTTLLRKARFDISGAQDTSAATDDSAMTASAGTGAREKQGGGPVQDAGHVQASTDADEAKTQSTEPRPDAILRMPFSDTELLAYVEMLSRESTGLGAKSMLIRGDLTLDLANRKAYYASTHRPMPLSRLEYDVLKALVEANGRFVGLDELQHSIGGYFTEEGLIRNALYTLDRKLRNAGLNLTRHDDAFRVI